MKKVPKEVQILLKTLADHFNQEDRAVRERQIRTWRKFKLLWSNFTNIWWDEVAHDWRIFDSERQADSYEDQTYYDKSINVFRAYLESIIAALSVSVPSITCYPDDAANPEDLSTAKAGGKIAQLVYRHNEVSLLWLHALFIYCTEGMVACYGRTKTDKKYGMQEIEEYRNEVKEAYVCPSCGIELDNDLFRSVEVEGMKDIQSLSAAQELESQEQNEFLPGDDDILLHDIINENQILCPSCATALDPGLQKSSLIVPRFVGRTSSPKTRICLEAYGGLYVKIPNYARKQSEIPYLRYSEEVHYSKVIERFPHLADLGRDLTGMTDPYEWWGRLSPQYNGEYPINNSTIDSYWFRPWSYNILNEDDAKLLRKHFPDGCNYVQVVGEFAHAENASLDDHWTILHNPLSDYLHFDPLGMLVSSVQEITNEMISLMLQTVEHGIPQGFADPTVFDFNKYRQTETTPGMIFPARPKSGKSLGESFYEIKTATFSPEYPNFFQLIQSMGQLTTGALPSLFGGQLEGSKTASEYSMSRSQALQRQQNVWKMFLVWWKEIFGKVIPMYIKIVTEDERDVERDEQGNFINVFIRKAELIGKIGKVEIEGTENLPMSWLQIKETITNLLQAQNPILMELILSPDNLPYVRQALGLTDVVIPGEADREKQLEEIQQLVDSEPIVLPGGIDEMGNPTEAQLPSVEVDAEVDNHRIEAAVCRSWLISDTGRLTKVENPKAYMNVLLHYKMHLQFEQLQMIQQTMSNPENAGAIAESENEESDGQRATVK
jgi:hypothetical protein